MRLKMTKAFKPLWRIHNRTYRIHARGYRKKQIAKCTDRLRSILRINRSPAGR